jgi:hypothetical protein
MPPSDRHTDARTPRLDDARDAFEAERGPAFDPDLRPELDLDLELDLGSGLDLDVDSEVAFAADLDLDAAVELDLDVAAAPDSPARLGSMLELVAPESRPARVYAAVAKSAQLISARGVARAAEAAGVAAPLRQGTAGARWRGATWLGLASLVATLWPGASRTRRLVAGALGAAAVLLGRFAIAEAGRASAADPRATLAPHHHLPPEHLHVP